MNALTPIRPTEAEITAALRALLDLVQDPIKATETTRTYLMGEFNPVTARARDVLRRAEGRELPAALRGVVS